MSGAGAAQSAIEPAIAHGIVPEVDRAAAGMTLARGKLADWRDGVRTEEDLVVRHRTTLHGLGEDAGRAINAQITVTQAVVSGLPGMEIEIPAAYE
jgi:hypothetical protein